MSEEKDNNIREIFEALLREEDKIIKFKPRRILEVLHAISEKESDIGIPLHLYIYLGKQYLINEKLEKAIELFKFIHDANPNAGAIEYLRAIFLKQAEEFNVEGKYDQAAEMLTRFSEIDPNDYIIAQKLAVMVTLYTKLSRIESINASWDRILSLWHIKYKQGGDKQYKDKILAKHKFFVAKFVELEKWKLAKEELSKILSVEPENMIAKRAFVQI